ncbi:MAG TPA: DUF86 domain-containing protein [Candidatus Hydrogenedentes bacterium]|nr:DUF86 domain-containing protein [Candidatus Hydrogenedentota bacterium]
MPHNPEKYLYDMLDSSQFLLNFIQGRQLADLREDRGFRAAVERELMIIGEAMWALSKTHADIASQIPEHNRIIRFRHILVHGYDQIDQDLVWIILQEKLPALCDVVAKLLNKPLNL